MKKSVIAAYLLLLSACGFHFRGSETFAQPLQTLYIQTDDPYSATMHYLKESLKESHVVLVNNSKAAKTILHILSETRSQDLLSVSNTLQTRQYGLNLYLQFELLNPQYEVIVPIQTLKETRLITIQANQILGGSNEENNLYRIMQRAIVFDLLNRLGSTDVTTLLLAKKVTHETH